MDLAHSVSKRPASSEAAAGDDRQWFITRDLHSIPVLESRPLYQSTGQWISGAFRYKVLRTKTDPEYAVECGRLVKAKHVPKRMQKYFDEISSKLKMSGFEEAFHTTVSAVGPYSSATLVMSRKEGDVHFFGSQTVTKINGQIHDETHCGFISWLKDGEPLITMSRVQLPSPRKGVDRWIVTSEDPTVVLKKHRQRILRKSVERVPVDQLFERLEAENRKQTDDWLARRVIRRANPAEITRIRTAIRV